MEFKDRLETLRRLRNLTQEELAKLSNTSLTTFRRWERGDTEPRLSELQALAKALHITVSELLEENVSERVTLRHGALSMDVPTTPEGLAFLEKKLEEFVAWEKSSEQSYKAG